ncbi:unnamed protein product [Rotaria magnacalcarata]|uniref:Uncharacterized protein n=1 Tax=Rotaria magnacalcarata TaxID=392030 RepID=A0A816S527_9BILA|nr:unnamed protein product [Rotaria magnacalcarata]
MNDKLLLKVSDMQTELAIIRQDIHAHPETSMEEERTSTFVASKLRECGLTVTEDIGRFGVVDTLTSLQPVNHEEQTKRAIKVAETVIGLANVNKNKDPQMGGEDFAFMLLKRPGAFIFMGINDEAVSVKLHSPDYNFNDDAIPFGVAYWISLVQQELNN